MSDVVLSSTVDDAAPSDVQRDECRVATHRVEPASDGSVFVSLLYELREKLPPVFTDATRTGTGGATQQPGGQVWDEDYDGD